MERTGIPRHEAWTVEYLADPYLRRATTDELHDRMRDLFLNVLTLTTGMKVGVLTRDDGMSLFRLVNDVFAEMRQRFGPYPSGFRVGFLEGLRIPSPRARDAEQAVVATRGRGGGAGHLLVKYGKREHMERLVDRGEIRLAGAISYRDPSLNSAVRDDELEVSARLRGVDLRVWAGRERRVLLARGSGDVEVTVASKTDFYAYCLSTALVSRMFLDFEADACVLIRDREEFVRRFRAALGSRLGEWRLSQGDVVYVDPWNPRDVPQEPYFAKHFKYGYQREHRLVALPPRAMERLDPVPLDLGNLRGICELLLLHP